MTNTMSIDLGTIAIVGCEREYDEENQCDPFTKTTEKKMILLEISTEEVPKFLVISTHVSATWKMKTILQWFW